MNMNIVFNRPELIKENLKITLKRKEKKYMIVNNIQYLVLNWSILM